MWRHVLIYVGDCVGRTNSNRLVLPLHVLDRPFSILFYLREACSDPRIRLKVRHVPKTYLRLNFTFLGTQLHFGYSWPLDLYKMNVVLVLNMISVRFETCLLVNLLLLERHVGRDRYARACY